MEYRGIAAFNPQVVNATPTSSWYTAPNPTQKEGEERTVEAGDFLIVTLYQCNCSGLPLKFSHDISYDGYRGAYSCC